MKTSVGRRRNAPTGGLIQIYDFTLCRVILAGATDFYSVQNIETGSGAKLASWSMNTGTYVQGINGRIVKIATHLHSVRRLRMSGVEPLFPFYVLMAWTEKP
jgi:hypothetical protein